MDSWGADKWKSELEDNHILVMTRQIFLDMLSHGFISISRVNLIIFDECHHAVKNDPYVQIMKFYNRERFENRPRILGLSASVIGSKCKPHKLETKIKELEATLNARVETASDLAEVAKYATNPRESLIVYGEIPNSHHSSLSSSLKSVISDLLTFIYLSLHSRRAGVVLKLLSGYLEECIYVIENISIRSAVDAVKLIQFEIQELWGESRDQWEMMLCHLTILKLSIFLRNCHQSLSDRADDCSPKFSKLLEILASDTSRRQSTSEPFCGIVFVEQRVTAMCLSQLIQELQIDGIRCSFIVGHSPSSAKILEKKCSRSGMNAKKQQDVLAKFRSGKLNLLIATSVVEEGLDVRKCNVVIRYDFPKTFQSHVQSKGRARAKDSRYLVLVDEAQRPQCERDLIEYMELETMLASLCRNRESPDEDEVSRRLKDLMRPYQPLGPGGPSLPLTGSLSLLHRLGRDQIIFMPSLWLGYNNNSCKQNTWYKVLFPTSLSSSDTVRSCLVINTLY